MCESDAQSSASSTSSHNAGDLDATSMLDDAMFSNAGVTSTTVPSNSVNTSMLVNGSIEFLHLCGECRQQGLPGRFDAGGVWICKTCSAMSDTLESIDSAGTTEEQQGQDRLYTCAECAKKPLLGAFDSDDGEWYCKECWEALLSLDDLVTEVSGSSAAAGTDNFAAQTSRAHDFRRQRF